MPSEPLPAPAEPSAARSPDRLPAACDVLVVGAGPAGSACAQRLAQAGWDVVLVDQQRFPRDKVCGDGLIPDAHQALRRLGVHDEVMAQARVAWAVGCVGPRGGRIDVPAELAVLPRRQLDDILKRAAERAGARFAAPWRFEAPLIENDRVVGAWLKPMAGAGAPDAPGAAAGTAAATTATTPTTATTTAATAATTATTSITAAHDPAHPPSPTGVRARWVVLATGAQPKALQAAGLRVRTTPSGVALRGYLRQPDAAVAAPATLDVVWHRRLRGGYGWVFPAPGGLVNIGVGLAASHAVGANGHGRMQDLNLRALFAAFTEVYAPAAALVAQGEWTAPLKGAPLRCSLDGAPFSRPGLLVTGEAAGSTFSFTGEGIGKAMHTGELAAQALLQGQAAGEGDAATRARYDAALQALVPRYRLYDRANRVNAHPWLADLLIWRAQRSPGIQRRMTGVLEETVNPGHLVSARGLFKLFMPGR